MTTVARFHKDKISITGGLHERLPMVLDGLVEHYPLDGTTGRYVPPKIRYIRDHLGYGSTANSSNHWVELQAFDEQGVNVALGKAVVSESGGAMNGVTDGNTATSPWYSASSYVEVDLGEPMRVERIVHWHYHGDGRTYYKTRLSVSEDGVNWFDIFDSAIEGEYREGPSGHEVYVYAGSREVDVLGIDGTFESEPIGQTSKWSTQGVTAIISTDVWRSGSRSLRIDTTGGNRRLYRTAVLKKGESITFSAMVYATTPGAFLRIELNGGSYSYAGTNSLTTHDGTGWERLEVTCPVSGGVLSDTTAILFIYGVVGQTIYADSVQARKRQIGTCSPLKEENLIQTEEGIVIQPYVKNLMRERSMNVTATAGNDTTGYYFTKTDADSWWRGVIVPDTPVEAGKTYTFSIDIRCDIAFTAKWDANVLASNYAGNDAAMASISFSDVYDTPGKWKRLHLTATLKADVANGVMNHSFCPAHSELKDHKLYYKDPMLHEGDFPLLPVPHYKGAGRLDFRLAQSSEWTISFRHRPHKPLASVIDQGSSPNIIQFGSYYGNASLSFWNYTKTLRVYMKGDTSSGWTGTTMFDTLTDALWDNVERHYVIVKRNHRTFDFYRDGILLGTATSTEDLSNITWFSLGVTSMPTATYRDLSIYNRALSAEEATKLARSPYSITKAGEMRIRTLNETGVDIPPGGVLLPLDDPSVMRTGKTEGQAEVLYDEGASFVTNGVKNVFITPPHKISNTVYFSWDTALHQGAVGPTGWSSGINPGVTSPTIGYHAMWQHEGMEGNPCMKFINRNDQFGLGKRWLGISTPIGTLDSLGWAVGDKVTVSWYQRVDVPGAGVLVGLYHKSIASGNWTFGSTIKDDFSQRVDVWERRSHTFDITSDMTRTDTVSFYFYGHHGEYGTTWIDKPHAENFPLPRPFVPGPGTVLKRTLHYNLNRDYGLKWNEDWSIVYWKKPIGTHAAKELHGYTIDSLGSNSNSVGGGYVWWGKTSGANLIASASPGTIDPAKYFGTWRMVSLVKSGGVITIREHELDGTVHVRTQSISTSRENYYVTQYGYDLKLGGWDNTNACNAAYRDLFFVQRALSQDEVQRMFDGGARLSGDTIRVREGIIEGAVL